MAQADMMSGSAIKTNLPIAGRRPLLRLRRLSLNDSFVIAELPCVAVIRG
ncbi:hypothetical protein [Roseomonas sp. KE2513]|nr:hypothetical protein [Roseomonas sp. KE2513]